MALLDACKQIRSTIKLTYPKNKNKHKCVMQKFEFTTDRAKKCTLGDSWNSSWTIAGSGGTGTFSLVLKVIALHSGVNEKTMGEALRSSDIVPSDSCSLLVSSNVLPKNAS